MELVLHRGTSYGRGLGVLAADSEELEELMTKLEKLKNTREHPLPSTSTRSESPSKKANSQLNRNDQTSQVSERNTKTVKENNFTHERILNSDLGSGELPRKKRKLRNSIDSSDGCSQLTCRDSDAITMDDSELQLTCDSFPVDSSLPNSLDRCMLETATGEGNVYNNYIMFDLII